MIRYTEDTSRRARLAVAYGLILSIAFSIMFITSWQDIIADTAKAFFYAGSLFNLSFKLIIIILIGASGLGILRGRPWPEKVISSIIFLIIVRLGIQVIFGLMLKDRSLTLVEGLSFTIPANPGGYIIGEIIYALPNIFMYILLNSCIEQEYLE
jgi:hypothetical protein